eukprot:764456-Hanusia_phi.AAC.5
MLRLLRRRKCRPAVVGHLVRGGAMPRKVTGPRRCIVRGHTDWTCASLNEMGGVLFVAASIFAIVLGERCWGAAGELTSLSHLQLRCAAVSVRISRSARTRSSRSDGRAATRSGSSEPQG